MRSAVAVDCWFTRHRDHPCSSVTACAELIGTAEEADDFARPGHGWKSAEPGARRAARTARRRARRISRAARLGSARASGRIALEEILAFSVFEPLRPLPPGAQRRIERQMAEQVEGIGVGLPGSCSASSSKLMPRSASAWMISERFAGSAHCCPQLRRGRAERPDRLGGIVGIAHDPKLLAVRVQLVDEMRRRSRPGRRRSRTFVGSPVGGSMISGPPSAGSAPAPSGSVSVDGRRLRLRR